MYRVEYSISGPEGQVTWIPPESRFDRVVPYVVFVIVVTVMVLIFVTPFCTGRFL